MEKTELMDQILSLENEMITTFTLMEKKLVDLKIKVERYGSELKKEFYGGIKNDDTHNKRV